MNNDKKILKALSAIHEDIEWLKQNTATKNDLSEERKETKTIAKEVLTGNNRVLGSIIQIEIARGKQEVIEAVKIGFQETAKELKNHRKRIEKLEHLSHS